MPNKPSVRSAIPLNLPADEVSRRLLRSPVEQEFDIALLRSGALARGKGFETIEDAQERRKEIIRRLEEIELTKTAHAIFDCTADVPCARVNCPVCGRLFRRWFTSQGLRQSCGLDLRVATVALELISSRELKEVDLKLLKGRAAQRIRRAAPSAEIVLGGIEAEYRESNDAFLLHAHLLIPILPTEEKAALASASEKNDVARAVKIQPLRDKPKQISYLLKFVTYHRPGSQNGPSRAMAVPLPNRALKRLVLWRRRHNFLDFVFMLGLRRSGSDLVRIGGGE